MSDVMDAEQKFIEAAVEQKKTLEAIALARAVRTMCEQDFTDKQIVDMIYNYVDEAIARLSAWGCGGCGEQKRKGICDA